MFELLALISTYAPAVTGVVTAANAITALTPTNVDNKILNIALKVLNFASMNFMMNKNKDA